MKIAIDGPAGAGKSTIAKLIAQKLGFIYIDTGAMYRTLTYKVLKAGINPEDKNAICNLVKSLNIQFDNHTNPQTVICNNEDVTIKIRTPEVTALVSKIAAISEIREVMVEMQRDMAATKNVVMDGRDIGECVLPDANFKFYITASLEERARRRKLELEEQGYIVDIEKLKEEIAQRDSLDANRKIGALKVLEDSIVINTSDLSIDELLDKLISIVREE